MNRRGFLQTVAFTLVAAYSPISLPRAKPPVPLSSIFTPGIWAGLTKDDFAFGEVEAHTMILRTTITHAEIERAQRGGTKYFLEKLEEIAKRDLESNLKMIQRDLGP